MARQARRYIIQYSSMSKLKLILISIIIIAIVAIAGYFTFNFFNNRSSSVAGVSNRKIKVGYTPTTSSLGVFVAQEKGYFKEQGLEVELIEFPGNSQINDALLRNDIDSSTGGGIATPLNSEITQSGKLKLFAVSDERKKVNWNSILLKKDSPISTLKDLENKQIGHFPGPASLWLKAFLKENQVDISKINFLPIDQGNQLTSLENNSIDALFTYEPNISIASQKQNIKILQPTVFITQNPNAATSSYSISTKFLNQNPDLAKRYILSMNQAFRYIRENPKEAIKSEFKYDKSLTPEIADKIAILDYYSSDEIPMEQLQTYVDYLAQISVIKQKIEIKDLIYKI
jgi:NitT/TauT family transport system substrate-binding protein